MVQSLTKDGIIKYGKANGYSAQQINKVIEGAKYDLANYGINSGFTGSQINNTLNALGYDNYNPIKAKANWENLWSNAKKDAKEFSKSMSTIGGMVVQPFIDVRDAKPGTKKEVVAKKFKETINNDRTKRMVAGATVGAVAGSALPIIGTAGGAITGGLLGLIGPKELADSALSTYDTKLSDFGKKSGKEILANASQGVFRHPLYAGIDYLSTPVVGAKAVGKVGSAIGNAIPSNAPLAIQALIPSAKAREFNRAGTLALEGSKASNYDMFKPLEELSTTLKFDNDQLTRFLMFGDKGNMNAKQLDLAKRILESVRKGEERAVQYGLLDKALSRKNVIAQYSMQKLMDKIPDVLHRDVMQYIDTGVLNPRIAEATINNPGLKQYIDDVINEGADLYDTRRTGFITQALTPTIDPRGEVVASKYAKTRDGYFGTSREIGRATLPEIANRIDDSLMYQQLQIAKGTQTLDFLDMMLGDSKFAKRLEDVNNIPKGKTVINRNILQAKIAEAIQNGSDVNILDALNASHVPEKGAFLVDDIYFNGLKNMLTPSKGGSVKDSLNAFKKTVLASPHWFIENRVGNWTNNSMGGVKLTDVADARRYWDLMPERLKTQTSFNSYVGDSSLSLPTVWSGPIKKIGKEWKRFGESNKSLEDIGRVTAQTLSNISNMASNPVFRLEAGMEAWDRFANFIRQAKREAKTQNTTWQDVVRKSNKDDKLFNKLNTAVNKDLGDYIGRNYLMPNWYYEKLGMLVPFYRFLTQTGRTTLHQLANHGPAFQATVMNPSRAGKKYADEISRVYGLDDKEYEGGVPYAVNDDGSYRFVGIEPLPFGAVARDLLSDSNKLSLLAPHYTMLGDIMNYRTGFGTLPSSPGLTEYKLAHGTANGYEPTLREMLGYGLNKSAKTFYAPARVMSGWGREAINQMIGKPTLSIYDTNLMKENPLSYSKELGAENVGKWIGIQTRPYYKKNTKKKTKPSKSETRRKRIYQEQYNRNTKKGNG